MTADNTTSEEEGEGPLTIRSDWTTFDRPSTAAVIAVGEATGREPETLPVLNELIDADALDTLLVESSGDVEVRFTYADTVVRVSGDGSVVVTPTE